jgi:hypothetical protein
MQLCYIRLICHADIVDNKAPDREHRDGPVYQPMPATSHGMEVELLIVYFLLMLALGPVTVLYGFFIVVLRRVRLTPGRTLCGGGAVATGIAIMIV